MVQIMRIGETANELKVRIELVILLINYDRPTINNYRYSVPQ